LRFFSFGGYGLALAALALMVLALSNAPPPFFEDRKGFNDLYEGRCVACSQQRVAFELSWVWETCGIPNTEFGSI